MLIIITHLINDIMSIKNYNSLVSQNWVMTRILKEPIFVAASRQTGLDTRSMTWRSIKVGIWGRKGRARADAQAQLTMMYLVHPKVAQPLLDRVRWRTNGANPFLKEQFSVLPSLNNFFSLRVQDLLNSINESLYLSKTFVWVSHKGFLKLPSLWYNYKGLFNQPLS